MIKRQVEPFNSRNTCDWSQKKGKRIALESADKIGEANPTLTISTQWKTQGDDGSDDR